MEGVGIGSYKLPGQCVEGNTQKLVTQLKWGAQNFSYKQHRNPPLPNVIVTGQAYNGDFPGGPGGKEPACQCRRCKRQEFDPWVRKIPWKRKWQPTPVFLPGESHGQKILAGCGS